MWVQAGLEAASEQTAQLVANMEAAAKQARAKAAASSKLDQTVQASKALWGSETPDDIELDQVRTCPPPLYSQAPADVYWCAFCLSFCLRPNREQL